MLRMIALVALAATFFIGIALEQVFIAVTAIYIAGAWLCLGFNKGASVRGTKHD